MTERGGNGVGFGPDMLDPETVERVALRIGARLRRYHAQLGETDVPAAFTDLLRELDRAERRI